MRIAARVLVAFLSGARSKPAAAAARVALIAVAAALPAAAQTPCRLDCPPRDDHELLQSILDECRAGRDCELPAGAFTIARPLEIGVTMRVKGAGRGSPKKPGQPITEIRVADGARQPAFAIAGTGEDIDVAIEDLVLQGGGIHVGGEREPCRGIDDPFDVFDASLFLKDVKIVTSALDAVRFRGGSLKVEDVDMGGSVEGMGLYVRQATGDVVVIDAEFVDNDKWGVYVCNLEGTGQIFMNDVSASGNGRGGIAIVGKGTPPTFRTLCMQNTGAAFNYRFGVLLFDVARTLLYNVAAGFSFSEPSGRFGDGFAISSSEELFFWNVAASLNNRAGFSAFGPSASEMTHVHLVGDFSALNNTLDLVIEGYAAFDPHHAPTEIAGLCGFTTPLTAPPHDPYCQQGVVEVPCAAVSPGLEPPESEP